jgi:hypothetical protein
VFRETKFKLDNSLEEGIISWGKYGVGYLLLPGTRAVVVDHLLRTIMAFW